MNKLKGVIGILLLLLCLLLVGCSNQKMITVKDFSQSSPISMFIIIENGSSYKVVYHRETKVMYIISQGVYNSGNFTVMLDADGLPLLYENN